MLALIINIVHAVCSHEMITACEECVAVFLKTTSEEAKVVSANEQTGMVRHGCEAMRDADGRLKEVQRTF